MSDAANEGAPPAAAPAGRKRMVFTKRDPEAAARIEAERQANMKSNPFGDAKPREAVIAQRTGKNETDVVAAEAQEYQVKVRLTPEQYAQKQERVQEINELKDTLAADPENAETVQADIQQKEDELQAMLKGFEELLIEKAKAGELPRPERKPRDEDGDGNYGGRFGGRGGGGGDDFGAGYGDGRRGGGRQGGGYGGDEPQGRGEFASVGFPEYQDRKPNRRQGGFQDRGAGGYQDAPGGGGGGGGGGFSRGGGGGGYQERGGGGGGFPDRGGGGGRRDDERPAGGQDDYQPLSER